MTKSGLFSVIKILSGPVLGLLAFFWMLHLSGNMLYAKTTLVVVWMAFWWITEAVSMFVTALLPLVLYPFLGVMDMKNVAPAYTNDIIFLYVGGFFFAFAIEKWNLHKKIAFYIILKFKNNANGILFGFMFSAFFLSMWISNVAATLLLLPAALAIGNQLEELGTAQKTNNFSTALLLGLAYSASIGGTATLIGTAPNLILSAFYNQNFPDLVPINFANWIIIGFPIAFVFFLITFLLLKTMLLKNLTFNINLAECKAEYDKIGKLGNESYTIIILFGITLLMWFLKSDIVIGSFIIKGWTNLLPQPKFIGDGTIAIAMGILLFLISFKSNKKLLTWEEAKNLPIGILFLFGGGFAMANGIAESGLSDYLAQGLVAFKSMNPILLIFLMTTIMLFFTEITSNTAATYLFLPIIISLTKSIDMHPILLMFPIVLAASYAFMLPIATPPNTVVFSSEKIKIGTMIKIGFILNVIAVFWLVISSYFLLKWLI